MATTLDVIEQHFAAFNARDAAADPWSADAELVAPGGAVLKGRDQVLGFLRVFQEAFPDGQLTHSPVLTDGPRAAVEAIFKGTHNGVLRTPGGDVPPTGKHVEFRSTAVFVVAGDQLASEHLYFDQLDLLQQLGLAPA